MALLLSAPSDSARRRAVRHLAPARLAVRIALVSAGADWRVIVPLALLLLAALVLLPSATADRPMRREKSKGHRAETQVRLEHFMCLPDGKHKWLLSRDFQADARTRTGDPFITSDEPMSAPVRSSHLRPLAESRWLDWSGLEMTGEDNLVDAWWTSEMLSVQTKAEEKWRERSVHPR